MANNNSGAISALKGYRVQFLYTLYRVLFHTESETTFEPEGKYEDLDIYNSKNELLEVIQVKALSGKLTLSNILNNKPNSFVKRALKTLQPYSKSKINLISFGEVNDDIIELAKPKVSKVLRNKLKTQGLKEIEIEILEQNFTYEIVSEETIKEKLCDKLIDLKIFADIKLSLDWRIRIT